MPGCVHRETERKANLFTDNGQRLVDAFRGIVAGFIQGFGIVKIQIIFHQIEDIPASGTLLLPPLQDVQGGLGKGNNMTFVRLDHYLP